MPNKPSKKLLLFLQETGAIHGTLEDIALAKKEYTRLYKKNWKQNTLKNKEIRATFTADEYSHIQRKAAARGMTPTTYIRKLALAPGGEPVPHTERLLLILQKLRMAAIRAARENTSFVPLLDEIERHLLEYLNQK